MRIELCQEPLQTVKSSGACANDGDGMSRQQFARIYFRGQFISPDVLLVFGWYLQLLTTTKPIARLSFEVFLLQCSYLLKSRIEQENLNN